MSVWIYNIIFHQECTKHSCRLIASNFYFVLTATLSLMMAYISPSCKGGKAIQQKMWTTYMHTLQFRILAGRLKSRSTCSCEDHRCPSHCMAPRSAWHSSCSSHTRPGPSSPPVNSKVLLGTCRATGRTAAFQQQSACLWEPAAHCSEPCWSTGWGGQRYILRALTITYPGDLNGRFWKSMKYAKNAILNSTPQPLTSCV